MHRHLMQFEILQRILELSFPQTFTPGSESSIPVCELLLLRADVYETLDFKSEKIRPK